MVDLLKEFDFVKLKESRAIEASAGTGKTFTLERIVLKLLLATPEDLVGSNTRMSIDELVLVTYTDKAAGELKERVREILEKTIAEFYKEHKLTPEDHSLLADILHLEENLNKIDQANISTIHGFCLKVLKTFAFESKSNFGLELIQDDDGLKSELRTFLRKDSFVAEEGIKAALWNELTSYLITQEQVVLKLAKEFISGTLESPEGLEAESFDEFCEKLINYKDSKGEIVRKMKLKHYESFVEYIPNITKMIQVLSSDSNPPKGIDYFKLLLSQHSRCNEEQWWELLLSNSFPSASAKFKKWDTDCLHPIIKEGVSLTAGKGAYFKKRISAVSNMKPSDYHKPYAITFTASQIAKSWAKKKTLQGKISFDDMIRLVSEAVNAEGSPLKKKLKEVYRYGIIDEFQDTDAKQWGIFKQVFLDSQDHVLYVVGDSKQSIYKFRGADLETFKSALEEIAEKREPAHNLVSNYRSTPQMIQSYNQLFSAKTETENFFKYSEEQEDYSPVKSGFENEPSEAFKKIFKSEENFWTPEEYQDYLQGNSSNFYVNVEAEYTGQMYRSYAQKVASHVFDLILKSKNTKAPIQPNQIAVLYQARARSREIREELERFGLPCAIYKEEGVFQSKAAFQWILLMEGLSSSQTLSQEVKKSFLTWFLRVSPEVLSDSENWSKHSTIQAALVKLDTWRALLKKSQWGTLFESIIRESQVMNYIAINDEDSDRVIADFHQVMEWMIDYLASNKGTWNDLELKLRAFYNEDLKTSQDQNLYSLESDRASIQFMTMHASKGLEFPIVINVLSATDNNTGDGYRVVQLEPAKKSIFWKTDAQLESGVTVKERFYWERDQERARLYYVAFTRASLFQYIPVFNEPHKDPIWPFDVFNVAAQDNFIPEVTIPPDTKWIVEAKEEEKTKKDGLNQLRSNILSTNRTKRKMPFQTSYSDLAHNQPTPKSDKGPEDEHGSLLGYTPEIRKKISDKTSLTPGSNTGDLLHNLFELSDWSEVMEHSVEELRGDYGEILDEDAESSDAPALGYTILLAQELKKAGLWTSEQTKLLERCKETTQIIKNTLECEIDEPETTYDLDSIGISKTFRLGDLPREDILPEMEFQFSFGEDAELFDANAKGGGWVKGFMDLVFRRPTSDGKYRYYVLDWKSNALEDYTQEEIDKSMKDSHYDVQAKLYQLAMHEWLQEAYESEGYDPEKFLGGAIYAYVRGNHKAPSRDSFLNYPLNLDDVNQSRETFVDKIKSHKKFNSGVQ